jgi:phage-related protein
MIKILNPCKKLIENLPLEIREDLADLLVRLDYGHKLSMPISRPMPSIGKNVHELRLSSKSGEFRIIYAIYKKGSVWLIHAFQKKSNKTSLKDIEISIKRFKSIL